MLPRQHRLTSSREFRAVARRGAKAGGQAVVVSVLLHAADQTDQSGPGAAPRTADGAAVCWRCGLTVSKAVGNAVVRHRTARRLRHIVLELIREEPFLLGTRAAARRTDLVLRALPGIADFEHPDLRAEVRSGIRRAVRKAEARGSLRSGSGHGS